MSNSSWFHAAGPKSGRRPVVAAVTAVAALASGALVATPAPEAYAGTDLAAARGLSRVATRQSVVRAAARYGTSRGYHVGVAVLDRATGAVYRGGDATGPFATESVVKVLIATRLLVSGQMHGQTAAMAYKMITQSDDNMATALYGRVGGDGLINWVERRYHLPGLGSPPRHAGWWGNTHITALGLVRLYARLARDARVRRWLLNAMHHARPYGSDGTYQFFGLPSATRGAAVKQGWGCDFTASCAEADFNSTGYVNGDRYAVALLVRGPISTYGSPIAGVLTGMARRLLPGGQFPAPPPVVLRTGRTRSSVAGGGTLTVVGRNFLNVRAVWLGTTRVRRVEALSPRRLRITLPPHPAGTVAVRVATAYGLSARRADVHVRYVAAPVVTRVSRHLVAAAGGTPVTVFGSGFLDVRRVGVGGAAATAVRTVTEHRLRFVAPKHPAGDAAVVVTTRFGRSQPLRKAVAFVAAPVISRLTPDAVGRSGGPVTVSGTNFRHVSQVLFGTQPGSDLRVASPDALTVTAPAHGAAAVRVRVIGEFGRSAPATIQYVGPPRIATTSLPDATVGQPYTAELRVADGRAGTWQVGPGELPSGLRLDGATIVGTPTQPGTATVDVTFTDAVGQRAERALTLAVAAG